MRGTKEKENKATVNYDITIKRAKEFSNESVAFDMCVNGIDIYGMWYREGTSKEGKPYEMITFPQEQGKDGKWYNKAYFKITDEIKVEIIEKLQAMI